MKFTVEKADILAALARCSSIADARSAMPCLANVLLEGNTGTLTVSATDINRSLAFHLNANVDDRGAICLPARDLYERIKLLADGKIAISTEGTQATLRTVGNTRRFTLHGLSAAEFPSIAAPSGTDGTLESSTVKLAALIGTVHHAISTDESRLHLNSLLLESDTNGIRLVSTDGHRLSTVLNGGEPRGRKWLIPLAAVNDLRRLFDAKNDQPVTLRQDRGSLFVELSNFVFSTKLVDAQFPPWEQVVPKSAKRTVTVDRVALAEALRAVAVSSSSRTGGVKFTFKKGALTLQAESHDTGEGFDEIASDYDGAPVVLGFNSKYFLDALNVIDTDQVTISTSDELDPAVIRAVGIEDFLEVVMPMRV